MTCCQVCGKSDTVRSHLLPLALALDTRAGSPHLHVGSIFDDGFEISQGGIFDDGILCNEHEQMLRPFDTYAVEFCRNFDARRVDIGEGRFLIKQVDSDLLVRFAVSVLWRFSVSTRREIPRVELGEFGKQFQNIVFDGASCNPEPALIMWANTSKLTNVKGMSILPTYGRQFGRRYWSFMVAGISFVLKVDGQPIPQRMAALPINGRDFILSAFKPFDTSHEFRGMLKIAENMMRPQARRMAATRPRKI
jgi:hypothetical protein